MTEGESGVTGVSIDRIFEFPREKRKRGWRTQYLRDAIRDRPEGATGSPDWVWSDFGPEASHAAYSTALAQAKVNYNNNAPEGAELLRQALTNPVFKDSATTNRNADRYCRSRGYDRVTNVDPYLNVAVFGAGPTRRAGPGSTGNYIVKVRRGILFRGGADCVRKVRRR